MHPELESLVKAYEAVQAASPTDAPSLFGQYWSKVEEAAARTKADKALLDRAVRWQHQRWVHAQSRPSTMPGKP